ncbi:MAG: S8 family serine peptidase, partial [Sedimentisphaerales bacterium]|nr:S8 family serine peptidase [Sedimentisphaerales bacterium]
MLKAAQLFAAIVSAVALSVSSLGTTINADPGVSPLPETLLYAPDRVVFELDRPEGDYGDESAQAREVLQGIASRHRFGQTVRLFAHGAEGPLKDVYLAHLSKGASPAKACQNLRADPAVKWAEPDYYYRCQLAPDDTYYNSTGSWGQEYADMWGLHAVNPDNAWDQAQGEGIVVAVIDTGVDYNHEDLYRDSNANNQLDPGEQYNIWINPGEDLNGNGYADANDFNGKDDDKNGYVDDIRGWNFIGGNNNPIDDHGHGSHCAGIIAGVGDNGRGIIGVAPRARVMIVKSLNSSGTGTSTQLSNGIMYAVNNGANVLSNSWGGGGQSDLIAGA